MSTAIAEPEAPAATGTHIKSVQVTNFKVVADCRITPTGELIVIGGDNEQGKSTVLDAILSLFGGKRYDPARPIRIGETKAEIVAELTDGTTIAKRFKADPISGQVTTTLHLADKDGLPIKAPQTHLDRLYSLTSFDPMSFKRGSPEDQAKTIETVIFTPAQVKARGENLFRRDAAFTKRTEVNRRAKELKTRLDPMPRHDGVPAEEQGAEAVNAEIQAVKRAEEFYRGLSQRVERLQREEANAIATVTARMTEVQRLQEKLLEAQEQLRHAEAERVEWADKINTAQAELANAPKPPSTEDLQAKLSAIEETNAKVRANRARAALVAEWEKADEEATALTVKIAGYDAARVQETTEALAKSALADMQIGFGEQGVTVKGLPFEHASSAEQLVISTEVACRANPNLRVCLIRDGSLLDEAHLGLVAAIARKAGAQVFIERVGTELAHIVMEEGIGRPGPAARNGNGEPTGI